MTKTVAKIFGAIVLLLGIIGLFSNSFIGANGYFMANAGLDIVNILLGIALFGVSGDEASSALWLKILGVVYALLAIIGFAIVTSAGTANVLGFMSFNMADNWLYLIIGAVMFIGGFMEEKEMSSMNLESHRTVH